MIQYVDSGNLAVDLSNYYNENRQPYYYQTSTNNLSFLKMVKTLKDLGIQNNKFHLILYDGELMNINPFTPNLPLEIQGRIIAEAARNLFYFLRECIRVPVPGAEIGSGISFDLHRGNLAIAYLFQNNFNFYVELPRQNYKTWTILACILWAYNLATSNSNMLFMHQQHPYAKNNLANMLALRNVLPSYMRFKEFWDSDAGNFKKHQENVETVTNQKNQNKVMTAPSARNDETADSIGRGMTQPIQFFDEFAFIQHNETIYMAASPAQMEAARKASQFGKPHLKIFASTPGDLATSHGAFAHKFINDSVPWIDRYYEWAPMHLAGLLQRSSSGFFYVKYHYQQLGRPDGYFDEQCLALNYNTFKIRREVLLQWNKSSDLAPFNPDELDRVEEFIKPEPIKIIYLEKYYPFQIFEDVDFSVPIMLGVDIADGVGRESSAIVAVNSRTGKEIGVLKSSAITTPELTRAIIELATRYIPNVVINIERNRGKGIIDTLLEIPQMRARMYWEHPGKMTKETVKNNWVTEHGNQSDRDYGHLISTETRPEMMDILINSVKFHPERFTSELMMTELRGLEIVKSGQGTRIDHGRTTGDDVIFAYLMAVYPIERGTNIIRFGITRFLERQATTGRDSNISAASTLIENADRQVFVDNMGQSQTYEPPTHKTYKDFEEEQRRELEKAGIELNRALGIRDTSKQPTQGQTVQLGRDFFKDLNN